MLRNLFLGVVFISTLSSSAQKSINEYEYIVVPESYSFLKKNDQYQLNSLTKFLFEKYGFKAFMNMAEYPEDLKNNGCKALRANVVKKPSVFQTRLIVELIDCNGAVVFASTEGKSREKEFKPAYHQALRNAFKDVKTLNYTFVQSKQEEVSKKEPITVSEGKVKEAVQLSTPTNKSIEYLFNEVNFIFEKQEYGYEMFKKEQEKMSVGKIYKSTSGKSYIVKAGELSGNGYFDGYGNFVLERINPVTNKLVTDTFARQ
ncbi:hypothetical protein [Aquimarina aquimarini]|uniref:hypothetical protein n=1 Tax=Aquimarina aquimarini TaxID=1191734 RepID=UPI000D54EBA4|nr:hypothetical protein [Aquimarina aquimarini]